VICKDPPEKVDSGSILRPSDKKIFYYQDVVEVLCDIGNVIKNDTLPNNMTSKMITCQDDGTWDSVFPNCTGELSVMMGCCGPRVQHEIVNGMASPISVP